MHVRFRSYQCTVWLRTSTLFTYPVSDLSYTILHLVYTYDSKHYIRLLKSQNLRPGGQNIFREHLFYLRSGGKLICWWHAREVPFVRGRDSLVPWFNKNGIGLKHLFLYIMEIYNILFFKFKIKERGHISLFGIARTTDGLRHGVTFYHHKRIISALIWLKK